MGNFCKINFPIDFKFRKNALNEFIEGENSYKTLETGIKVVRIKTHKRNVT